MASLGDFADRGGRTYRFEGSPLAFRFCWGFWGLSHDVGRVHAENFRPAGFN